KTYLFPARGKHQFSPHFGLGYRVFLDLPLRIPSPESQESRRDSSTCQPSIPAREGCRVVYPESQESRRELQHMPAHRSLRVRDVGWCTRLLLGATAGAAEDQRRNGLSTSLRLGCGENISFPRVGAHKPDASCGQSRQRG